MVIYRKKHDHLQICDWCGTSIIPVDANTEYDDHLAECPVLLHFATWLSIPFLPRQHGDFPGRHSNANDGGVGKHGIGLRGTKRPFAEEKKGPNLKALFAKQRWESGGQFQNALSDGAAPSSTREGFDGGAGSEQLCSLHLNQQGGHDGTFASGECELEESSERKSGDNALKTTPVSVLVEDSTPQGAQAERLQTDRSTVGVQSAISAVAEGRIMAISGVECSKEEPGAGWQEEEHTDGRNADTSRANVPYGGGSRSSCPISLSSIQIQGCTGASLEIRDRCEKQQIAHSHSDVGGLHSLATPVPTHQKASPDPKQAGRRVDEDQQIQLQRQKLCVRLMDLTLRNPNVLCFLNTVFLTTFWVHLLCSDFNMMTWGKLTLPLQTLLLAEMAAPLCLRTHPLFQDMLEQWQVLRAHGQQDYGEFLCFYLGWLGTKLVSQAYQRRFLTDAGVVIAEENKGYAPILLHADLWQDLVLNPSFQTVIDRWTQINGMTTALTIASTLVCFEVCRFQNMQQNDDTSFDFASLTAYLTVFINACMDTARIPYRVVALVSYTGDSLHGHYTCAISYTNSFGEDRWLYHDDNKVPQVWQIIPEWYTWTVTHVWLVRHDRFASWMEPSRCSEPSAHSDIRAMALERVLSSLQT